MQQILASHQVTLEIKESATISGMKERSRAISGLTAPLYAAAGFFAVRAPVRGAAAQHCIPIDWQADAARWRNGEMIWRTGASNWSPVKQWCHLSTLADHSGATQYARSAYEHPRRFDFKSAWFAPPDPE